MVYDLAWTPDGRVVMEGRVYPEAGPSQLAKALYRRLITYPGELHAHPDYGCRLRTPGCFASRPSRPSTPC